MLVAAAAAAAAAEEEEGEEEEVFRDEAEIPSVALERSELVGGNVVKGLARGGTPNQGPIVPVFGNKLA